MIAEPPVRGLDLNYDLGTMSVSADSEFAMNLWMLITKHGIRKVIETGTYLGTGTTAVIASALDDLIENKVVAVEDVTFITIEAKKEHADIAEDNLRKSGFDAFTTVLRGLSIPEDLLPTPQAIKEWTVDAVKDLPIVADHHESDRVYRYYSETANVQHDDQLGFALGKMNYRPDFVLLDSAGHVGLAEWEYLTDNLKGPCFIALDDVFHIKHYRSFQRMTEDSRYDIRYLSREKYGACIAHYCP